MLQLASFNVTLALTIMLNFDYPSHVSRFSLGGNAHPWFVFPSLFLLPQPHIVIFNNTLVFLQLTVK